MSIFLHLRLVNPIKTKQYAIIHACLEVYALVSWANQGVCICVKMSLQAAVVFSQQQLHCLDKSPTEQLYFEDKCKEKNI